MRKRLGRKGIKLRNRLIFISFFVLLIFSINSILKYQNKLLEKEKYAKQTESLIKARDNIIENSQGTTYYISANGTSTDGTDINNPMSLKIANTKTYNGNDIILFKAGDTFYGTISFKVNTIEDNFLYINSYGEGEKPIISGANILINKNAWILEDNLYKLDLSQYENFEGIGKTYWEPYNIGFFADEEGNIYGNRKNSKEKIEKEYDYYCEGKYIYVKCSENPSNKLGKIKFVARTNLVNLSSNTIMENLNIQYTGAHGVVKKNSELKNVYIKNCIIQNIGGCLAVPKTFTRYGNGIEFWNSATNTIVENCIFRNIYDAAYTPQGNIVTKGFENNICRNNIFINSTYTYETFCRNDEDKTVEIYMKGQQFVNNISINQGQGDLYNSRPETDKIAPAEFVFWIVPSDDTDILISNNKYYNTRMLHYRSTFYNMSSTDYKKCVNSDNNKIYLSTETKLMNSKGNYFDRAILEEYGIEQNSEFNLLTDYEIEKISNEEILNSNDYNEIKAYYDNLEEEFKYMEIEEKLLEQYKNLAKTYDAQIEQNAKLKNQITQMQKTIENIIKENSIINTEKTIELLKENYNIAQTTIEEKIDVYENIIKEINEIGNIYSKIFELNTIENNYDLTNLQEKLNAIEAKAEENKDLQLEIVDYLVKTSKEYYNTYVSSTEQNASKTVCKAVQIEQLINLANKILDINIEEYIKNAVVTIKYSTTEPTNQDVIATVETTANIQITNNSNSKEYVFDKNGTFTFHYEVKGQAFDITATVNNIDKKAPEITGVTNGKIYTQAVTPKITDKNLKEIQLTFNGETVEEYESNIELQDEGYYVITAIDKAGNSTKVEFQILINQDKGYQVQEGIIKNIANCTNREDFEEQLGFATTYTITRNGEEIAEDAKIATGDILTTEAGDRYTLIVTGDLNRDGYVTIHDIIKLRIYLVYENNLDEIEQIAADCNLDNKKLSISDLIRMRIIALMKDMTE